MATNLRIGEACAGIQASLQTSLQLPTDTACGDTTIVKHILELLDYENQGGTAIEDKRRLVITTRQITRLTKRCWPVFGGDFLFFGNENSPFIALPLDVFIEALSFLPLRALYDMKLVALMFAMPQPALPSSRTVTAAVFYRLGGPSRLIDINDPRDLWLRAAPTSLMVRCLVVRERRFLRTEFTLYVQDTTRGNEVLMLMAIKHHDS